METSDFKDNKEGILDREMQKFENFLKSTVDVYEKQIYFIEKEAFETNFFGKSRISATLFIIIVFLFMLSVKLTSYDHFLY